MFFRITCNANAKTVFFPILSLLCRYFPVPKSWICFTKSEAYLWFSYRRLKIFFTFHCIIHQEQPILIPKYIQSNQKIFWFLLCKSTTKNVWTVSTLYLFWIAEQIPKVPGRILVIFRSIKPFPFQKIYSSGSCNINKRWFELHSKGQYFYTNLPLLFVEEQSQMIKAFCRWRFLYMVQISFFLVVCYQLLVVGFSFNGKLPSTDNHQPSNWN